MIYIYIYISKRGSYLGTLSMELPQPTCDFIGEEPEEEEACNEVCGLSQGSTQASEVVAPWCQWRDLDFD